MSFPPHSQNFLSKAQTFGLQAHRHLHAFEHGAEDHVLAVEDLARPQRDELRAARAL